MNVPCDMCLENPAASQHPCQYDRNKKCNCCTECSNACGDDWYKDIAASEDEELVRYWNSVDDPSEEEALQQ